MINKYVVSALSSLLHQVYHCNSVHIMEAGQIILEGLAKYLAQNPMVKQAYLG